MRKGFFLSLICCLLSLFCFSQSLTCYSLDEALLYKDSVKTLVLKKQKLYSFPLEILELKNLERLDISRNYIKEIPSQIQELRHLHYINAAQNLLAALPKELSELPIDTLVLWDNMIRVFDTSFANLDLKYLDIRAIQMTRKEQKAIKNLFPKARIRKDHPCNCGDRKE